MKIKKAIQLVALVLLVGAACISCIDLPAPKNPPEQLEVPPPHEHTVVIDQGIEASCTSVGMTEGKHCAECQEVLVAQTEIPPAAHTVVVDASVEATCTSTGLTEGKHCSVCNEVLLAQTVVPMMPHAEVVDAAIPATCTTGGMTEGKHCSECDAILVEQSVVDALGHTTVTDPAIKGTCIKHGKTEGSHCATCGEVFVAQKIIKAPGHTFGEWSIVKAPTHMAVGERVHSCQVCQKTESDTLDVVRLEGKLGSTGSIADRTVIVSVFADDSETKWDLLSAEDQYTVEAMRERLGVAVDWLERQCLANGVETELFYDWAEDPSLFCTMDFSYKRMIKDATEVHTAADVYYDQRAYAMQYIDGEALKQKYDAENIVYVFYFNVPGTVENRSWAMCDLSYCDVEIINIYTRNLFYNGTALQPASTFAHELLHCFGVPDLYCASATIPQEYVDYCGQIGSKDIMFRVNLDYEITELFTEVSAYYAGLTDSCSDLSQWGLGTNMFVE